MHKHGPLKISLLCLAIVFVWSVIHPKDLFTWYLESFPVILGIPILWGLRHKFRFTDFAYILFAIHAVILLIGGHYTYAEVPLFNWIRDAFALSRNHYDRLGHLAQGFIPGLIAREVFIRKRIVKEGGWMFFLVCCFCLALSACYELLEWRVAVGTGSKADAFLGTQGDVWDTQEDMAMALIGSVLGQLLLAKFQDKLLVRQGLVAKN